MIREYLPAFATNWPDQNMTVGGEISRLFQTLRERFKTETLAMHQRSESDAACPALDGERRCTSAGVSAMSSARSWALVSDLTIGLGALAAGVGTFLFFTGRSQVDTSRVAHGSARRVSEPTWSWRLAALPHGARGTLAHSF